MRAHKRVERTCPPPCGRTFMARATDTRQEKGCGRYCSRVCSGRASAAARAARKVQGATSA